MGQDGTYRLATEGVAGSNPVVRSRWRRISCERSSRARRSERASRTDTSARWLPRRPRDAGRLPHATTCRSDRLSVQDVEPALGGPRTRRPRLGRRDPRWLAGVARIGSNVLDRVAPRHGYGALPISERGRLAKMVSLEDGASRARISPWTTSSGSRTKPGAPHPGAGSAPDRLRVLGRSNRWYRPQNRGVANLRHSCGRRVRQ